MANQRNTARQLELVELDRSDNLALPVPAKEAPGADQVDAAALSLAVDEFDPDSVDLGADEPEELWEDGKDTYAREVGISRWREL